MSQRKRILVAPLNWGLGHATRCIPIILELQKQGAEVFIASDGRALELLRQEFPDLPTFELSSCNARYPSGNPLRNFILQIPNLLRAVFLEHREVRLLVRANEINGIISDNRFGCYCRKVRCVFVTHQLFIKMPSRLLEKIVRQVNYYFISRFNECWLPDVEGQPNLSGELSHSEQFPKNFTFHYLGALSRMVKKEVKKKYDLIVVLSGPEPERTNFEHLILQQAKNLQQQILILQGKTEEAVHFFYNNIEIISHLSSQELNEAILASDLFIGRSGYTSIMDLAKLGKRAVLIPTPGQTEQEYLADYFYQQGIFFCQSQMAFDLKIALEEAPKFKGLSESFFNEEALRGVVENFLSRL